MVTGVLLAGTGTVLWTAPEWLLDRLGQWYPGCLYRVPVPKRVIALTIDDGPDPVSTPAILEELQRHGARATFFLITDRLRDQDSLVTRLSAEGHEVGNHFTRDRPGIRLSPLEFERDLLQADRQLARWKPVWARPGSGWYSNAMVAVMQRHGYRCALGSIYPFDASIPSVSWSTSFILRNVRPGSIVVLHDGGARGRRTARVLARVLPELRHRGYEVVSVSELVSLGRAAVPKKNSAIFRPAARPSRMA